MQSTDEIRLLLVDDDDTCRTALARLLSSAGFVVATAATPEAAELHLRAGQIEVVISDIRMPGNNQLEWTRQLLQRQPPIPVVLLTGSPELPTAIAAANLPIAAYLLKPPDPTELSRVVRQAARFMRQQSVFAALVGDLRELTQNHQSRGLDPEMLNLLTSAANVLNLECGRGIFNCSMSSADTWRPAVRDAVAVLQRTRQNFRSKELGALRLRLATLLAETEPAPAAGAIDSRGQFENAARAGSPV